MRDEYFGIKELYEVVLKTKIPMQFGERSLEEGEPVLYFEKVNMALLSEKSSPIMARGGWSNMPQVIWEDRSEVQFTLTEGVMNSVGMGMLLSAGVTHVEKDEGLVVSKTEGPLDLNADSELYLTHWPVDNNTKKAFIYQYERDTIQKKMYGRRIHGRKDPWDPDIERPCVQVYNDKACTELADATKKYIVDYYFNYENEALVYTVEKERFNGLFTLEGKFYSKDETKGINYTNIIYMPKVRVVSDINLRLGEKADPTISVFNIIGLPENKAGNKNGLILEITHLNDNIDVN